VSYLRAASGLPLGIKPCFNLEKRKFMKMELVVETSTHLVIRKYGGDGHGKESCQPEVPPWTNSLVDPCQSELELDRRIHA